MRLTSLNLSQYGNFASEHITLEPAPGRITMVVAPNGAGKSVLRQAFGDLLFGIGGQSPMAFRFPTKGMRIMAEAVTADGAPLRFGRRKGQGVTLIDAQGQLLAAGLLAPVLGSADRALLEQLFALDTERLRRGAAGLLQSGGSLADALLAGAGGLRQASVLCSELCAARDALAPARKSARPYYRALDALAAAQKQKRQDTQTPRDQAQRQAVLEEAQSRLDALNAACRTHAAALAMLQRVRRIRPILAELGQAELWLSEHPQAPLLPDNLAQRLSTAREMYLRAQDALQASHTRLQQAEKDAAAISPDAAMLAAAQDIDALLGEASAAAQDADDLPGREGEQREAISRIGSLLRDLGSSVRVEQAGEAVAPRPAKRAAGRLIQTHGEIEAALQRLPSRIALVQRSRDELVAAADALPEADAPDGDMLPALIEEIRRQGDPGQQESQLSDALLEKRAAVATALARVPGWTKGLAMLAALPVPLLARLEGLEEARSRAQGSVQTAQAACASLAQDRERQEDGLRQLSADGALPDAQAVQEARLHRDHGWHLVFQHLAGPAPPREAVAAWAGFTPLPLAYEHAVTAADRLADRRAGEAQRLADAEACKAGLARIEEKALRAASVLERAQEEARTAQAAWNEACAEAGQRPAATLAELRAFLACREAALQARREECHAEESLASLRERHCAWAGRLAPALGYPQPPHIPCVALLLKADALCKQREQTQRQRDLARSKLRTVQDQLDGLNAELAEREAEMQTWQEEWETALRAMGRDAWERPATVADVLEAMGDLEREWQASAKLAERIDGMRSRVAAFAQRVAALASRHGIAPGNTLAALDELRRRLAAARDAASRADQLHRALRQAQAEAARCEAACAAAAADLRAVVAASGADSEQEAEQRIALAASAAAHRRSEAEALARLLEAGDGKLHDELRAESETIAEEELAGAVRRESDAQHEASQAAQAQAAELARLRLDMTRGEDPDSLLRAAASEASEIATAGRVLDEAMVLHVAHLLLVQAMRAIETGGESTLVRRIGAMFSQLTDGAFAEAKAGQGEDGTAELHVVERAFPDEDRRIAQLSEGTRDQLFLALRLVAIEAYVAGGAEALPFIADDILQTFDDARAQAALRTLVAFSRTTQVIVLTHHEHLVGLAARLPIHIHRLGQGSA